MPDRGNQNKIFGYQKGDITFLHVVLKFFVKVVLLGSKKTFLHSLIHGFQVSDPSLIMTSQNNSSSNNNNASWYIFGVKSRDKSSQAIYTLEYRGDGSGFGVSLNVF